MQRSEGVEVCYHTIIVFVSVSVSVLTHSQCFLFFWFSNRYQGVPPTRALVKIQESGV